MGTDTAPDPLDAVQRLCDAISAHDLDALVDCFAADFHSELPIYPDASFTGSDGVRRTWGMILSAVPDITAEIVRSTVDGETVWAEWEQRGDQTDGKPHLARGVVVFEIADGRIASNRFYLDRVHQGMPDVLGARE